MIRAAALILSIGIVTIAAPARSQSGLLYCTGSLNKMYIHDSGDLMVFMSYRNDWTKLCNVKADHQGISPIVCQAWLTTLKDALAGNGTGTGTRMSVTIQYVTTQTCATLSTYSATPKAGYVMVVAQ